MAQIVLAALEPQGFVLVSPRAFTSVCKVFALSAHLEQVFGLLAEALSPRVACLQLQIRIHFYIAFRVEVFYHKSFIFLPSIN